MTLNQLRYFREVCRYESISKAADKLRVSQPSVSVGIKNLEDELNLTLIYRKNTKIIITEAGMKLYKTICSVLDSLDSTIVNLRRQENHANPEIRIGVPPVTGICVLPDIVSKVHDSSRIHLNVIEEAYVKLLKMVSNELIDCTLCLNDGDKVEGLAYDYVASLELCFCVSRENPLSLQPDISFRQIDSMPIASLENDSYNFKKISTLYRKNDCRPNIVFQSNRPYAMIEFVRRSPECGMFLPRELVSNYKDIVPLSLNPREYMDICVAYRPEALDIQEFRSFVELIT